MSKRINQASRANTKGGKNRRVVVVDDGMDHGITDPNKGLACGFRQPQPFLATQVKSSKIRFLVNATIGTLTLNASDILKLHGFAVSATVGYGIARAIQFKYIELWEPYQGTASVASVAGVIFYGTGATNTGTNNERYASSASPDAPAHLLAKPPRGTLLGEWQNVASSLVICDIVNLSVGAFVDIAFNYISGENQTSANLNFATSGLSAGQVGVHSPSALLSAVGLNNI